MQHLHSDGNEGMFSYDGVWRNGRPNGLGTYMFMDKVTHTYPPNLSHTHVLRHLDILTVLGLLLSCPVQATYVGTFKDGTPHGEGTATYPNGHKVVSAPCPRGAYVRTTLLHVALT